MKKKVLLITALTSMVLASVATVLVVSNKQLRGVEAGTQNYTISLDKNNAAGEATFDEYNWFYRFQLVGATKRDGYPFVSDPDYSYFADYFTYGGDHILTLDNPGYSGNFVYIAFDFDGPGELASCYAECVVDGDCTTIDLVEMYGQMTFSYNFQDGHYHSLVLDAIVFEYSC